MVLAAAPLRAAHEVEPQTLSGLRTNEFAMDKQAHAECDKALELPKGRPVSFVKGSVEDGSREVHKSGCCLSLCDRESDITTPQALPGLHNSDKQIISRCRINQYKHKLSETFQTLSECPPSHAYEKFPASRKIPIVILWLLF